MTGSFQFNSVLIPGTQSAPPSRPHLILKFTPRTIHKQGSYAMYIIFWPGGPLTLYDLFDKG